MHRESLRECHEKNFCFQCTRFVHGFDITGVTNTVVFTVANATEDISTPCGCFLICLKNNLTCTSYVWKFNGGPHRDCIIYSNFNLPNGTTLVYDPSSEAGFIENPTQEGGPVPHCLNEDQCPSSHDPHCVSGPLFMLDNGKFVC